MAEPTTRDERWRLALGADAPGEKTALSPRLQAMDKAMGKLYDEGVPGLGASSPQVSRWLGDIRDYFPQRVVKLMQSDAMSRFNLKQLLLEKEMLAAVEPDVHLVATLASLSGVLPEESKETARRVVRQVVDQVERRLADQLVQAVRGALNRSARTARPRHGDIDWNRTVAANLKHYVPELNTVVPERLVGYGRRSPQVQREFVICMDQSGSMAASVVYASIFACVMASIRSVRTSLVAYDTAVVDLTEQLTDPVDVIFGVQLGGGTDTVPALQYARGLVTKPRDTVFMLISDLYDTEPARMVAQLAELAAEGMTVIVLLALDDDGKPSYSHDTAATLAGLGIPTFACTPDAFPELLATAIQHGDLTAWAESNSR